MKRNLAITAARAAALEGDLLEHWVRVPELTAGERSGLFAMEDALYGCYLRVGDPGPWAGPLGRHRPPGDAVRHRPGRRGRGGRAGRGVAAGLCVGAAPMESHMQASLGRLSADIAAVNTRIDNVLLADRDRVRS